MATLERAIPAQGPSNRARVSRDLPSDPPSRYANMLTSSIDRQGRKKPFAWMKRFANFRHHGSEDGTTSNRKGKARSIPAVQASKSPTKPGANYLPANSTRPLSPTSGNAGLARAVAQHHENHYNDEQLRQQSTISPYDENHDQQPIMDSDRSIAPTYITNPETIHSEAGQSRHGTSYTVGGGKSSISGGGNSVFSSPNHSSHSLSTTLTTIQSSTPSTFYHPGQGSAPTGSHTGHHHHQSQPSQNSTYFSHQYPQTPVSAVPQHLHPHHASHVPLTYRSATANNLLTDNASILTLASSTHPRGRRNSLDTNASIRAIPPTSTWGGSRESLPLSTFSQTESFTGASGPVLPPVISSAGSIYQAQYQPSIGVASTERASAYNNAPTKSDDTNYASYSSASRSLNDGGSFRGGSGTAEGSLHEGHQIGSDSVGNDI